MNYNKFIARMILPFNSMRYYMRTNSRPDVTYFIRQFEKPHHHRSIKHICIHMYMYTRLHLYIIMSTSFQQRVGGHQCSPHTITFLIRFFHEAGVNIECIVTILMRCHIYMPINSIPDRLWTLVSVLGARRYENRD